MLISTHSAREDGDEIRTLYEGYTMVISTHSAREDGDRVDEPISADLAEISTHSAREDGDSGAGPGVHRDRISTHSAREDGDGAIPGIRMQGINFNPLRPRGRRRMPGY